MRLVVRRVLAIAVSAGLFAMSWWVCQKLVRLDEAASLGVAGAVLAVAMAMAGWWAAREGPRASGLDATRRVVQKARGGKDVNIAGRDQIVINDRRRDG